jgi:hypothetical protein
LSLKKLDYLSRSQIQKIHRLGSDRNARRILQELEPYVSHFRDGEKIYYLSKHGRERVNCEKVRKRTLQARHYLMRNDVYIAYNYPVTWKNEMKISVPDLVTVISDAMFKAEKIIHLVEVDHLQRMPKNRKKIESYQKLKRSGVFEQNYGHFPRLLWVTTTEHRRKELERLCEGLNVKIYTVNDFQ